MAQPFCYTLNQSGGNSSVTSVHWIFNDAAAKSSAGLPEAKPFFTSAWWHFQIPGPVGVLAELD